MQKRFGPWARKALWELGCENVMATIVANRYHSCLPPDLLPTELVQSVAGVCVHAGDLGKLAFARCDEARQGLCSLYPARCGLFAPKGLRLAGYEVEEFLVSVRPLGGDVVHVVLGHSDGSVPEIQELPQGKPTGRSCLVAGRRGLGGRRRGTRGSWFGNRRRLARFGSTGWSRAAGARGLCWRLCGDWWVPGVRA